jgi:hypothetical protein
MERLFNFAWKVQEVLSAVVGLPVALLSKALFRFWESPWSRRREPRRGTDEGSASSLPRRLGPGPPDQAGGKPTGGLPRHRGG